MTNHSFSTTTHVSVSPQNALDAITNVTSWWATNVKGNTKNLNDVFTVRFGKTFASIHVTEIIPDKKLVWVITDCDLPLFDNPKAWLNTRIIWEISPTNNTTQIHFTHDGLTPEVCCYEDCKKGWSFYITESLQKLIREGHGLPGTGIFANISNCDRKYEGLLYFKNDPLPEYPENFFFIDVQETCGEKVTKTYAAANYRKENFNPQLLKGEYFMIIENKPLYNNQPPLKDLLELI